MVRTCDRLELNPVLLHVSEVNRDSGSGVSLFHGAETELKPGLLSPQTLAEQWHNAQSWRKGPLRHRKKEVVR